MNKIGLCFFSLAVVLVFVTLTDGQNNNFRASQRVNNNNGFNSNNRAVTNNNRFNNNRNNNRLSNNNNRVVVSNNNNNNNNRLSNNNFHATPADRLDSSGTEIYPGCNGTVCLPQANLCATRKTKVGHFNFGKKSYWVSWASDEQDLRNARWNWFTGRNYCRKMCMDMVSFETQNEHNFIEGLMRTTGIKDIHTAGRLCDKEVEGCEQERFNPKNINGWFWASTLQMMHPTNQASSPDKFNNWATTGSRNAPQPDGAIKADGFGVEACVAMIDDSRYGGLKWHDESCATRRHIVCEDLPQPNINFVRNNNPNIKIP